MGITPDETERVRLNMLAHDRRDNPGLVRASFGMYNTLEEVDTFVEALEKIVRGEYKGVYVQDPASGDFFPDGWEAQYEDFFEI